MRSHWDFLLAVQILAIGAISLLIIFSINRNLAQNQFIFWLMGLIVLYFVSHFDYKSLKNITVPLYLIVLTSLVLLLLFGEPIRGSVRWVDLGIFRVQPSEIAKAAIILLLATFYGNRSAKDLKNVFLSFLIVLPSALLVFLQPDIGNTLAILAIWFGISLISGLRLAPIVLLAIILGTLAFVFFETLAPYQKQRIESFINPGQDPLGTGYNIIQSKIAIGAGQILGKGFAQGSQSQLKFLPEAESDFIFASIAEQLGFLGAALLLFVYSSLLLRLIHFAKRAERFGQLVLFGIASFFLAQFLINVGMNMGLLPVTGITYPLVSYGGLSLIVSLFLLGLVFSVIRFNRRS